MPKKPVLGAFVRKLSVFSGKGLAWRMQEHYLRCIKLTLYMSCFTIYIKIFVKNLLKVIKYFLQGPIRYYSQLRHKIGVKHVSSIMWYGLYDSSFSIYV